MVEDGWSKTERKTRGRVGAHLAPPSTRIFAPCHISLTLRPETVNSVISIPVKIFLLKDTSAYTADPGSVACYKFVSNSVHFIARLICIHHGKL